MYVYADWCRSPPVCVAQGAPHNVCHGLPPSTVRCKTVAWPRHAPSQLSIYTINTCMSKHNIRESRRQRPGGIWLVRFQRGSKTQYEYPAGPAVSPSDTGAAGSTDSMEASSFFMVGWSMGRPAATPGLGTSAALGGDMSFFRLADDCPASVSQVNRRSDIES